MKKVILVLDFDDTLFEAKRLKQDIFSLFEKEFRIARAVVEDVYTQSKHGGYSMEKHAALLQAQAPDVSADKIRTAMEAFYTTMQGYVFPDVLPVLERLKAKGVELILLTYGEHDFQSRKIAGTGLAQLCEKVVITTDAKSAAVKELFRDTHHMVTVDNTIEHLNDIKSALSEVETIAIDRYGDVQPVEIIPHVHVKTMEEVEQFVLSAISS